jgi:uncharacterized heparinase superfamily protein
VGSEVVALLGQGVFRHLNEERHLGRDRPDWRLGPVGADRLWTVTLHYHAWADALAEVASAPPTAEAAGAAELLRYYVGDWIARCPVEAEGARSLAWNAYAIATRISWWVRAYHRMRSDRFPGWQPFAEGLLRSLWQQAAYLAEHLEWDLRANHLLRDAAGLAWAGRFFREDAANGWLRTATRLAIEQAAEQVLPDGGHFERSPMYHLHVMEDIFSLALLAPDEAARSRLRDTWLRMADYLAWVRHPDGEVPLLNDGGLHAACAPARMLGLGALLQAATDASPRRGGRHFRDTGLVVWHGDPWSVFFDVGPVGPDYQPGHAHADTLTLECSFGGRRLFVDPGTYAYDHDRRRQYDRSTAAHNTVAIDDADSSEVWHIFRVGRRARPFQVESRCAGNELRAAAAHDGYDHLPGRPRHHRVVAIDRDGVLRVTDHIAGSRRHRVAGGVLLAPNWTAEAMGGGWRLNQDSETVQVQVRGPERLALAAERRPCHPEYGREVETTRLTWRAEGECPVEVTLTAGRV